MTKVALVGVGFTRRRHPCQIFAAGKIQRQLRIAGQGFWGRSYLAHPPLAYVFTGGRENMSELGSGEGHGSVNPDALAEHLTGIRGHSRGQIHCYHLRAMQLLVEVADNLKWEAF